MYLRYRSCSGSCIRRFSSGRCSGM